MTIFVDEVQHYPKCKLRYKYWSHMATDQDDLTELHAMAVRLGLRQYFQDHKTLPHYDVTPLKRVLAIRGGAIAVSHKVFVRKCSSLFKEKAENDTQTGTSKP